MQMTSQSKLTPIDTIVIGGGHAGLTMSYYLQEKNREHVILEKNRALEQWRSKRWDSFILNTPMAFSRLIGQQDDIPDTQMSISRQQSLNLWDEHIRKRQFPIHENTQVEKVELDDQGNFLIKIQHSTQVYQARNIVAATGFYQIPNIPSYSSLLKSDIQQLRVGTYRNPSQIQNGAVLVVGGGQTGVQISEELLQSGIKVYLATSKIKGCFRSYRGEDLFFWLDRMGLLTKSKETLPDPNMRYGRVPITGSNHPISHHSLARLGATLLGGLSGFSEDGKLAYFKNNLKENLEFAKESYDSLIQLVENWITENDLNSKYPPPSPESEWEPYSSLFEEKAPLELQLEEYNIKTVFWATGWKADFSWLSIENIKKELGPYGNPESCNTSVPGFFWLGYPWLRIFNSANLSGFHHDASHILSCLR